ncbi:mitochondrial assembly of ribosomal large subunit protein 1 [Elysia marginata]|uniref:Mitochondrial assembly of ribosomal large subunit protein 1 n=1 Tax=Elysia marginata TaxID=1093978 RepID=A0AAV4F820_9GAST|nr:mitochondrial assembly of ribosomal large subunit protein 1 [Elysia marginata]
MKDKDNQQTTQSNNSNEMDSYGDTADKSKSILDNDPELRSIIEDIKQDFAREHSKDNKEPETPKREDNQSKFAAEDNIEFDYSVAEDIEEYDYIDESEIGQHEVQAVKNIPLSLERGENGVFELEELLQLLDHLGAEDIASFPVPPEARFCDYMVVVSAKSRRHLQAINEEMLYIRTFSGLKLQNQRKGKPQLLQSKITKFHRKTHRQGHLACQTAMLVGGTPPHIQPIEVLSSCDAS